MRVSHPKILILLSILLSASLLLPTTHAGSTWSIQAIGPNSPVSTNRIAVDSNNTPHIAYTQFDNDNYLMYANLNGSNWDTQKVTEGSLLDFKMDSENNPHLLYVNSNSMMYANWTGTTWYLQTVGQEGCRAASLDIDTHGDPHVAYIVNLAGGDKTRELTNVALLKYASLTGTNWSFQSVDAPVSIVGRVFLALDSQNRPHITYCYENPGTNQSQKSSLSVKYAVLNGEKWDIQTAFTGLSAYGNLVLDSNGYPHFTIVKNSPQGPQHWDNMTLTYAGWDGTDWITRGVDSNITAGRTGYLALDSHGNPHTVYLTINRSSDSDDLTYARWTGIEWDIQTVGPNSYVYQGCALAIGSNGNPYITYIGVNGYPVEAVATCMYATTTIEPTPTPTATPTASAADAQTLPIVALLITVPIVAVAVILSILYIRKKVNNENKTRLLTPDQLL